MCKYCNVVFDEMEDIEDILSMNIPISIGNYSDDKFIQILCHVDKFHRERGASDEYRDTPVLKVYSDVSDYGNILGTGYAKINYCPMCGRKLV